MVGTAPRMLIGTAQEVSIGSSRKDVEVERDPDRLVQRVIKQSFDLVVVDLMMPRLSLPLLQKLVEVGPRVFTVSASFIGRLAQHMEESPTLESVAALLMGVPVQGRPSSRLVRAPSPEEVAELNTEALQVAFEERKTILHGSLTTREVADLLGSSQQTPDDRAQAKTLLAIEDNGGRRFPAWQFDPNGPDGVIDGLAEVLKELSVGPLAQARWLQRPNPILEGRTPLEALRGGDLKRVIAEARAVGAAVGARG